MTTTTDNQAAILAELWLDYRDEDNFKDFVSYNDVGLPLAYLIAYKIVLPTELSNRFLGETFDLLLSGLGVDDTGFDSLQDLLDDGLTMEQEE